MIHQDQEIGSPGSPIYILQQSHQQGGGNAGAYNFSGGQPGGSGGGAGGEPCGTPANGNRTSVGTGNSPPVRPSTR
jgi:hypothetical protein